MKWNDLAWCENVSGHANKAEALARLAIEFVTKIFPEEHPVIATAMLEQATALRSLRHKKPARDLEKWAKAWLRSNANGNLAGYTVDVRSLTGAGMRQMPYAISRNCRMSATSDLQVRVGQQWFTNCLNFRIAAV